MRQTENGLNGLFKFNVFNLIDKQYRQNRRYMCKIAQTGNYTGHQRLSHCASRLININETGAFQLTGLIPYHFKRLCLFYTNCAVTVRCS